MSNTKANRPSARISSVSTRRNLSATIVPPMVMPSRIVTRLASSFWAVLLRRSSTPHSRMRLPNMRLPTSGALIGTMMPATAVTMMGKRIRASLLARSSL